MVNNGLQADRLCFFAEHASFALQFITICDDFDFNKRLQSPLLQLGTNDLVERNQAEREFNAFGHMKICESDHRLVHCGPAGNSNQLEYANVRKAKWWIGILQPPSPGQPKSDMVVSFYLFYFLFFIY